MARFEINMDSFGDTCPTNWEEIVAYLNDIINGYTDELTTVDSDGVESIDEYALRDRVDKLWEAFCSGDLDGAPAPIMGE